MTTGLPANIKERRIFAESSQRNLNSFENQ